MQPQDGTGVDWSHILSGLGGVILTAILAAVGWLYRAGGREPTLKSELHKDIEEAEKRVEAKIDEVERRAEEKIEEMVGHFQEAFSGLRQKINDVERETLRDFMLKEDFKSFREQFMEAFKEFRDDQKKEFAELKSNISMIIGGKK